MALITIQFGSRASSSTLNNNFRYLAELIQSQIQSLTAIVNNSKSSMEAITASLETTLYKIGEPKISLVNTLQNNEIWLEGAEVLQTDYPNLYAVYGDTYGTATQTGYFKLPDFRNRTLWGSSDFGYLTAGLPNAVATLTFGGYGSLTGTGAFKTRSGSTGYNASPQSNASGKATIDFSLANSNSIFGSSDTVRPPSIKIRVKTN